MSQQDVLPTQPAPVMPDLLEAVQNGPVPTGCDPETSPEELNYQAVPPRVVADVSVCFRAGGRGRPLPFPLDEEADA